MFPFYEVNGDKISKDHSIKWEKNYKLWIHCEKKPIESDNAINGYKYMGRFKKIDIMWEVQSFKKINLISSSDNFTFKLFQILTAFVETTWNSILNVLTLFLPQWMAFL